MPISRYGIVAAMSTNRVIGVNGALPWNLVEDRRRYKDLTRGHKVLILGRNTLAEDANLRHLSHAAHAIILSRTLTESDLPTSPSGFLQLTLAQSFPHALDQARQLCLQPAFATDDSIPCWVVGGERVYHEALLHPSAEELHLTVVDTVIDEEGPHDRISRFPPKYRWDNKFRILSSEEKVDDASGLAYRFDVYRRLRGRR